MTNRANIIDKLNKQKINKTNKMINTTDTINGRNEEKDKHHKLKNKNKP